MFSYLTHSGQRDTALAVRGCRYSCIFNLAAMLYQRRPVLPENIEVVMVSVLWPVVMVSAPWICPFR